MGTTAALYALSENSNYFSKKWSLVVALAPPLAMPQISSPLFNVLASEANFYFLEMALDFLNVYELFPANWLNQGVFMYVCNYVPQFCKLGNYFLADYDPNLNDDISTKVYFSHFPSGSSIRQIAHFT